MSDRRSHKDRTEALERALVDLRRLEVESSGHDLDVNVELLLSRHGFGEAWSVGWSALGGSWVVVTLTVENTTIPEFVLLRYENDCSWMDTPSERQPSHLWTMYA